MTPTTPPPPPPTGLFARLNSNDRERLGAALRHLLAHGSILGLEGGQAELYHWCYQNRDWVEEVAGLVDLKLFWDHELRLAQAVPQRGDFLLRLKLDATLVILTLWYEFDTAVRDRGETPPVQLRVEQLNDSLRAKFEPLKRHLPSTSRLREILALAQRKNLIQFAPEAAFERTMIDLLPTLKRVIPFQNLEEWTRHVDRQLASSVAAAGEVIGDQSAEEVISEQATEEEIGEQAGEAEVIGEQSGGEKVIGEEQTMEETAGDEPAAPDEDQQPEEGA